MEYFGAYFSDHGRFPLVINTKGLAGMSNTLFYAHFFYSVCGLFSIFLGSAVTFRLLAFLVLLFQFYHVERAMREIGGHHGYAFLIALIVTWATYPLTNIYCRAAITEFFGVALLYCSFSCLLVLLKRLVEGKRSWYDAVSIGFFFLVLCLTHTLTGLYGAMAMGLVGVSGLLYVRSGWLLGVYGISAVLGVCGLASWLYPTLRFARYLPINDPDYVSRDWFWTGDYGWRLFLEVFGPVPHDRNALRFGTIAESAYLEIQCMVPLLVLGAGLLWLYVASRSVAATEEDAPAAGPPTRSLRGLCLALLPAMLVIFLVASVVVVLPFLSNYMGRIFHAMQYPYRLVSYVNFGLIGLIWILLGLVSKQLTSPSTLRLVPMHVIVAIVVTLCITSVSTKLLHSTPLLDMYYYDRTEKDIWRARVIPANEWKPGIFRINKNVDDLPHTFYSQGDFEITHGTSTEKTSVTRTELVAFRPPPGGGPGTFGTTAPVTIDLPEATCVITNLSPFPWNKLVIDGHVADVSRLTTPMFTPMKFSPYHDVSSYSVVLGPGKHTLEYRLELDPLWQKLYIMAWVVAAGWLAVWLVVVAIHRGAIAEFMRQPLLPGGAV